MMDQVRVREILQLAAPETSATEMPLLPPPEKLFGFTYVSFFIEKTTLPVSVVSPANNNATGAGGGSFSLSPGTGLWGGSTGRKSGKWAEGGGETALHATPTTAAIDRVADRLYFVRVSVYSAKGKLTEAQQVGGEA